jgi:TolB-like protein/DNA-binding winged helix-turn-helix (wHTH) protein/cytochrome c-type biogenesis protein CcmH/NrfG
MDNLYRFGSYLLDQRKRALSKDGSPIALTPKAFDVLLFLVQNPNRLITKEELFKAVWADSFVEEGNLTQNIFLLRKALAQNSEDSGLILTIPRKGYQFAADVAEQLESTDKAAIRTPAFRISAVSATQTAVEGTRRNRDESPQTAFLKVSELAKVEQAPSKPGSRFRLAFVLSTIAVILVVAGYISWQRFRIVSTPRSEKIMLAVLPFQNLTGDPNEEYLADGLTEEMISQLGRLHPEELGVIARTSVMGYKHSDQRLDQIGRDLSVQYVLENSLRGSGNHLRVTVQLVQVKDQSHLWAQDYDYRPGDILRLEDDVAKAVAREIQIRLTPQQEADLTRVRPVNPDAFEAHLEGRYFLDRDSNGDTDRALRYYEQAIKLDSSYAPAWVGLSRVRFRQADRGFVPLEDGQRQAREAAERAVTLDPNLAEAHAQIGRMKMFADWDWAGANASVQRALALDPANSSVLDVAAGLADYLGHSEEALELFRREIAVDPLNAGSRESLAQACFEMGRVEEAEVSFKKALELNPDLPFNHELLGLIYLAQGRGQDALTEIEREPLTISRLQGLAVAYYALGRRKESDAALSELTTKYQTSWAFQIAEVYAFRKEPDKAFVWLDRAYVQHDGGVPDTKGSALLKNLHGDPRYTAFLKKMNLPL